MAQLITAQEVIDIAFTNLNTDINLIKDSFIEIAQEEHIRPALALGELDAVNSLYAEIVEQNNSMTLTADNLELLEDYIKPCLAHFVKFEMIEDMQMQTTSQGIMINTTDHSNAASSRDRAALKESTYKHAITLRDKMTRWIEDVANLSKFPKYTSANNIGNWISKTGGIVVGTSYTPSIDRK